jgi:hypothetical protein
MEVALTELHIEPGTPFSGDDISLIETSLGRKLPAQYVKFVKEHGSGFVGGLIDGNQSLPIWPTLGTFASGVTICGY